jgi:hypothetical protein
MLACVFCLQGQGRAFQRGIDAGLDLSIDFASGRPMLARAAAGMMKVISFVDVCKMICWIL